MSERPTLYTERLILRPHTLDDAKELQRLIGERTIADTTLRIPHPYEDGMAEEFISRRQENFERGVSVQFAITHREQGFFMGGIGLGIEYKQDESMQLGFWVGKEYWNQGYCTEAAKAILKYGFEVLGLHRIYARHFARNPASGRVLQKISMKQEGTLRDAVKKMGDI